MTAAEVIALRSSLRRHAAQTFRLVEWSTFWQREAKVNRLQCQFRSLTVAACERSAPRLEGMAIADYAIGATDGYIYVRAEYPLAVKRLTLAIHQAEEAGLLGKRIGGTTFGFHVELRLGGGAFVCGEETALLASIEGKRGTPRPRPPYPAESGLWNSPTLINNVETFANIAPIIKNGGEWYARVGTKEQGHQVFAGGRANNTGGRSRWYYAR
jgi:NADH:ubiquinone oxidoreductase subunit F (NADH-binding)